MTKPVAVAIYARISSDPTGQALGVQRQLEDCYALAKARGFVVAEEYVDNDVSAYAGKPRPAYERMLADIRDGYRDGVIVYHLDRLTRRPMELEEFIAVCERAGVRDVVTVTADVDMGNDDGMFMARISAAVAAKESARKSERVKRKLQQNAEMGLPGGGANRPFGFEPDKVTIRESEAVIVREMVERFLAGDSARSLASDLEARGIPTATLGQWRSTSVRHILRSPRIAGLRAHNGEVVGKAIWPGIITSEQHEKVLAEFARRAKSGRRAARRYLLSGLLRCGKCGGRLFSSARESSRRYVCLTGPDHGGCGGIMIEAHRVEEWLTAAVLYRLDTPEMEAVLTGQQVKDERFADVSAERDRLQARMTELSQMFAEGEISRLEWKAARDPLEAALTTADRQLSRMGNASTLSQLVGNGQALRAGWSDLNLERQHAIIKAVLDFATITPAKSRGHFNPDRIVPTWVL